MQQLKIYKIGLVILSFIVLAAAGFFFESQPVKNISNIKRQSKNENLIKKQNDSIINEE